MMEKREDLKRVVENINQRDQLLSMEDDKVNQKYGAEVEETITAQGMSSFFLCSPPLFTI